ncbi:hypothetical protein F4803DRAFT_443052 [Xylaria telfairii]|nr:hypothetical protein F4803DRAFT_443052 [Xylaria telfairii]
MWEKLGLGILGLRISGIVILRILWILQLYAVERLSVARQELIVRIGWVTQRLLFLPRALWIVPKEEPGMSGRAIRNSAKFLAIPFSLSAVMLFRSWLHGLNILQDLWTFVLGLAVPTSCVLSVWVVLAASQRSGSKQLPAATDLEKGGAKPLNKLGLDENEPGHFHLPRQSPA